MPSDPPPAKGRKPTPVPADTETLRPTPENDPATLLPPTEGPTVSPASAKAQAPFGSLPATFGRYQLLKVLGQGGMGTVYLAHDTQLDRRVALKVPQFTAGDGPEIMERFFREARAAATLHHPNICPVYDVAELQGTHYLTMAYIEGRPLSALIDGNRKPLPLRQIAALVRKLALALEEAHHHKVIHRDLKPSNIMLSPRGEPVIMDFGLARRGNPSDARLTQQGSIMGTPAYMAPEQARGNPDEMGPACDIYSLGVILYEMLAQRLPFEGDPFAILSQVLMEEPAPPSTHRADLDCALEAICLKALAKKPQARYRTMAELASALTDYLKGTPTATGSAAATVSAATLPFAEPAAEVPPPRVRTTRRQPTPRAFPWVWVALAGAGAVVVVLGAGAVIASLLLFRGSSSPERVADVPTLQPSSPSPMPAGNPPAPPVPVHPPEKPPGPPPPVQLQNPGPGVSYAWPAEALRGEVIPAPDLTKVKPWFRDHFADPRSGFIRGKFENGEYGYRNGLYFAQLTGRGVFRARVPLDRATPANPTGEFACEAVARLEGRGQWGLAFLDGPASDAPIHFAVRLAPEAGRLVVVHGTSAAGEVTDTAELPGTVTHPAIKKGSSSFNALRVLVRAHDVEVYVNGWAVCDPILLEKDIPAPHVALVCWNPTRIGTTAEFQSVTLWSAASIPPLEKRGAIPKKK